MAEHLTVAQVVVGSRPIIRPDGLPRGGYLFCVGCPIEGCYGFETHKVPLWDHPPRFAVTTIWSSLLV